MLVYYSFWSRGQAKAKAISDWSVFNLADVILSKPLFRLRIPYLDEPLCPCLHYTDQMSPSINGLPLYFPIKLLHCYNTNTLDYSICCLIVIWYDDDHGKKIIVIILLLIIKLCVGGVFDDDNNNNKYTIIK